MIDTLSRKKCSLDCCGIEYRLNETFFFILKVFTMFIV